MRAQLIDREGVVRRAVSDGVRAIEFLEWPESVRFIAEVGVLLAQCFRRGNKVLIAGNGGSLCDGQHFAEELTGQYRKMRRALPAIALNDPGLLSCVANDMGFERVFARGVEALGQRGDVLVLLTTSGNSPNLIEAAKMAREKGMGVVSFLGKTGGKLKGMADLELLVEGFEFSDRIQEAHMTAIHTIIEVIEYELFYGPEADG